MSENQLAEPFTVFTVGGEEPCFVILALPAFLPFVISSFVTQNRGALPSSLDPPLISRY